MNDSHGWRDALEPAGQGMTVLGALWLLLTTWDACTLRIAGRSGGGHEVVTGQATPTVEAGFTIDRVLKQPTGVSSGSFEGTISLAH